MLTIQRDKNYGNTKSRMGVHRKHIYPRLRDLREDLLEEVWGMSKAEPKERQEDGGLWGL